MVALVWVIEPCVPVVESDEMLAVCPDGTTAWVVKDIERERLASSAGLCVAATRAPESTARAMPGTANATANPAVRIFFLTRNERPPRLVMKPIPIV